MTSKDIKFNVIKIFTLLIVFQFLLSISTSFIDTGIYNLLSICILSLFIFIYIVYKKQILLLKKELYLILILTLILFYNLCLSVTNSKKLFVTLSCFITGFLFSKISNDTNNKNILKKINYILLFTCIYGVIESFIGNFLDTFTVRVYDATYRLHSIFLHPIIFSLMMIIAFWLSYYFIENRILKFTFCIMTMYCVIMTLSRSSWITFGITILLNIIKSRMDKKSVLFIKKKITSKRLIEIFVILCITFVIFMNVDLVSIFNSMISRWRDLDNSMSVLYRSNSINTLLLIRLKDKNIINWLIGGGYHSVQSVAANAGIYFGTIGNNVIDNQWISIFYDFGLIGAMSMIYIFIKSIIVFFYTKDNTLKSISIICFTCLFMGLFCDIFEWSTSANITFFFIGLFVYRINYFKTS